MEYECQLCFDQRLTAPLCLVMCGHVFCTPCLLEARNAGVTDCATCLKSYIGANPCFIGTPTVSLQFLLLILRLGHDVMTSEQERIYGKWKAHQFHAGSPDESQSDSQGEGLRRSQRNRNRPGHLINFGRSYVDLSKK